MTPRRRRMTLVLGIVAGVGIATALALSALRHNVTFYFVPSEIAAGKAPVGQSIRLGGMVTRGSLQRVPGTLQIHFRVTDTHHEVPVTYDKVLPDLFREGAGVVAHGRLTSDGTFVADDVLAKHDEKYMPPKMGEALKTHRGESREESPTPQADGAGGSGNAPQQVPRPAAGS